MKRRKIMFNGEMLRALACLTLLLSSVLAGCGTADRRAGALASAPPSARYTPPPADAALPVLPAGEPEPVVRGEPLRDEGIQFVVEAAIARKELPGCVIAVGDHDGLRYIRAFGERTSGEPMTLTTRFDLASLTKPIATAAAIMLLAERGVVDLAAPARNYLRELNRDDKRSITVEQLLLHTSGLPKVNALSSYEQGRARARQIIADEPLSTRPGTRFDYSDLGFILLGDIVESVSSQDLATFARTQLFEPLGMRHTHFTPPPGQANLYAPTELREDVLIRGEVDDPRAYRLGGVAGHAGLFSTAYDIARFAQMLLRKGELDGMRVLQESTVERFIAPQRTPPALRSLGFDVLSSYALGRGRAMSASAFGHGGYTGTSLWVDPERDLFVVLLSNRVHVGRGGTIHPLASAVADLAVAALTPSGEPQVKLGVDVLREEQFARLRGRSVALLSHEPARDGQGQSTVELLSRAPQVTLKTIFSPEHGFSAKAEGHVANSALQGVPVHSLFGRTRKPTPQMLAGVDTVVIDIVDVGTRFYTYMATALKVMEAAAELAIPVVLLDRPNPLDGVHVEGPLAEPAFESFVNYHPLPLRHGMTAGELARFLVRARDMSVALHVVPLAGWQRAHWFAQTGLRWHPPSPNLHTPGQALLYPAVGLVEGTNLSVGRGTERAFSVVGAPFLRADALAKALSETGLEGVQVAATRFRPRVGPYKGELLPGVTFDVTEPERYSASRTGLALAAALRALHPEHWDTARLPQLVGRADTVRLLIEGAPLPELERSAQQDLEDFRQRRLQALLYP